MQRFRELKIIVIYIRKGRGSLKEISTNSKCLNRYDITFVIVLINYVYYDYYHYVY